jgi:hypothetical protein
MRSLLNCQQLFLRLSKLFYGTLPALRGLLPPRIEVILWFVFLFLAFSVTTRVATKTNLFWFRS